MPITDKKFSLKFFFLLALCNLTVYACYHISYLLGYGLLEYIRSYVADIWEFLHIPLVAVFMLEAKHRGGNMLALRLAALASVSRIFYCIPYYYMEFMKASYPPNSVDSIILSLLFTFVMVVLTFAHLYLIYGLIHLFCHIWSKGQKDFFSRAFSEDVSFSFTSDASVICLAVCLIQFIIKLIGVISDTISFLGDYGGAYTIPEIITILLDYIICLGLFAFSYIMLIRVRGYIQGKDKSASNPKGE